MERYNAGDNTGSGVMGEEILIISADDTLAGTFRRCLEAEGLVVEAALDGWEGLSAAQEHPIELVILDISAAGPEWLQICRQICQMDRSPLLLVLSPADDPADHIAALEAGADDFVVWPQTLEVLLARVRALLRRAQPAPGEILEYGDLTLDTASRTATRGDRQISLTTTEYELLLLFLRNPERVLPRELIMERVWGYDFAGNYNILEVYVSYLRSKLEEKGERRLIQTVRGAGYVLREQEEPSEVSA